MSRQLLMPLLLLALTAGGCNDDSDVFEKIAKLRAVGVATTPLFGQPSTEAAPQSVTLTFHAAVPLGNTVTAEPFVDGGAKYAFPAALTLVPGSELYQDQAAIRMFQIQATLPMPTIAQLPILPEPGFARLRYGIKLKSGDEEETIVGNVLIYPTGAPELAWQNQAIDIAAPIAGGAVSDESELKGTITKTIDENIRVAWFVTTGKLKNRRAKETEWLEPASGAATLILTTRGLKSGAFAMKVVDVTVN